MKIRKRIRFILYFLALFLFVQFLINGEAPVFSLLEQKRVSENVEMKFIFSLPNGKMAQDGHIHILDTEGYKIIEQKISPLKKVTMWGEEYEVVKGAQNKLDLSVLFKDEIIPDSVIFKIEYQLCDEKGCYPPAFLDLMVDIFKDLQKEDNKTPEIEGENKEDKGFLDVKGKNPLIVIALLFIFGVMTSFTPCIYPMIPITLGIIGTQSGKSIYYNFLRSFFYVSGISLTYSILGVFSAYSGNAFGSWLGNSYVLIFLTVFFVLMALSSFDYFFIDFKLGGDKIQAGGSGFVSVFIKGMVAGLAMSPCLGPAVLAIMAFIAESRSPVLGFFYMLSFGYGLGMLLLVLGTLVGQKNIMPRSGAWMTEMKKVVGLILFLAPLYFWYGVLSETKYAMVVSMFIFMVPIVTNYLKEYIQAGQNQKNLKGFVSFLCFFLALAFMVKAIDNPGVSSKVLREGERISLEEVIQKAQADKKLIIVDFYASWCTYCKQYDKYFKSGELKGYLDARYHLIKIDYDSEKDIVEKFNIKGVPTILFLDSDGNEFPGTRIEQGLPKEELKQRVEKIYESNYTSN